MMSVLYNRTVLRRTKELSSEGLFDENREN